MIGAIIGDYVGSKYEFTGLKIKNFSFKSKECHITDDTLMTLAVANTLYNCKDNLDDKCSLQQEVIKQMKDIYNKYPNANYGVNFENWLKSIKPTHYNSYGNGSAMRISPVGWVSESEEQVKVLSKTLTEISHNHLEGLKGAEAIAMCVYLARIGKTKKEIEDYVVKNYYPAIEGEDFFVMQKSYGHLDRNEPDSFREYVTCQGSVPQAIQAFLASTDFVDAISNALMLGGDSDTLACMTGSIAEAYYGVDLKLENEMLNKLSDDLYLIYELFTKIRKERKSKNSYSRMD